MSILHSLKFHDCVTKHNVAQMNSEDITQRIRESMRESHKWTNENFGKFVAELDDKDWQSDVIFWSDKYVFK